MLAIVLSRRDFRESDQMISVYTKEKGKLNLLARGIKKIISKNSAHLEPFSLVEIEVAPGKEIDHLTKVVPVNYFSNIRANLHASLAAGFVVSTTDKLLQTHESDSRIFELLKGWLNSVDLIPTQGRDPDFTSGQLTTSIDGYMVALLHCLGYDIASAGVTINHDSIYQFLIYHTDRKIADWSKLLLEAGKM